LHADAAARGAEASLAVRPRGADLALVMALIDAELSEPYSIFTYRYFINNWRRLCFLVRAAGWGEWLPALR
jgi:peptide alpha-N-acetyltransferase